MNLSSRLSFRISAQPVQVAETLVRAPAERPDLRDPKASNVILDRVTLVRGSLPVFDNLSLNLQEHRIGIIGDNGVGKSSLFRLLCGLEVPNAGRVLVQGVEAGGPGHQPGTVAMMFQNPDEQIIFATVEEELALGLEVTGTPRRLARENARQWLQTRGLGHWAGRAIASLSQGQRQHVCWLALTINAPSLLLLDEPFASLDLPGQALLNHEIQQAAPQIIVSTHLLDHVRGFERVIWLAQGRVQADGPGREICVAYEADVARRIGLQVLQRNGSRPTEKCETMDLTMACPA